jgi:hypothetical protein
MPLIRSAVTFLVAVTLGLATAPGAHAQTDYAEFVDIAPCRVADTRNAPGPYGGPALPAGMPRNFSIFGHCAVPVTALAVSFNFTIVNPAGPGHLTVWPAGGAAPQVSTLNYVAGEVVANAAIVPLSAAGAISVQSLRSAHLVIDVNGYFADLEELASHNTAVGQGAFAGGVGSANTALGAFALDQGNIGNFNVALSYQALTSLTGGSFNVAVGADALANLSTGIGNTLSATWRSVT